MPHMLATGVLYYTCSNADGIVLQELQEEVHDLRLQARELHEEANFKFEDRDSMHRNLRKSSREVLVLRNLVSTCSYALLIKIVQ